jgi:hypothetical protein
MLLLFNSYRARSWCPHRPIWDLRTFSSSRLVVEASERPVVVQGWLTHGNVPGSFWSFFSPWKFPSDGCATTLLSLFTWLTPPFSAAAQDLSSSFEGCSSASASPLKLMYFKAEQEWLPIADVLQGLDHVSMMYFRVFYVKLEGLVIILFFLLVPSCNSHSPPLNETSDTSGPYLC